MIKSYYENVGFGKRMQKRGLVPNKAPHLKILELQKLQLGEPDTFA